MVRNPYGREFKIIAVPEQSCGSLSFHRLKRGQPISSDVKLDSAINIDVLPEVYNPSDDTYLLLDVMDVSPGQRLLEIGSGTGILAIHAAKQGAEVTALDINPHAVECTKQNALKNNVSIKVVRGDLFEGITEEFDVVIFNPPYLPGKVASTSWIEKAWSGGEEGGEIAVRFLAEAWKHLASGGSVYLVLSSLGGLTSVLFGFRSLDDPVVKFYN